MILRKILVVVLLYGSWMAAGLAEDTPQDIYYKLYFDMTEAARLEKKDDYTNALNRYEEINKGLTDIKKRFPDWEPSIIHFRLNFVHERIANLKEKAEAQASAPGATPTPLTPSSPGGNPSVAPLTPIPPPSNEPGSPSSVPSIDTPTIPSTPGEDIGTLHRRITQLETELATTKNLLVNAQLEISTLRDRLASAEKELNDARSTNVEDRIASILKENNDLKAQINDATQKIKSLQGGSDATALAQLRDQLQGVQEQLTRLSSENQSFRSTNADLKQQLELAQQRLADSGKGPAATPNDDSIRQENEVLRDIVTRQLREQARRDAAKKLAKEEIDNLQIKSDVLQKQIEILSSPLVALSPDQLAMLRLPVVNSISAPQTATAAPMEPMPTNPMPGSVNPPAKSVATTPPASAPATNPGTGSGSSPSGSDVGTRAKVPADMKDTATQAADYFRKGHDDSTAYEQSANLYNKIIEKYPDSLYAWSNLGVVRFEQQHYPEAEKALLQAIKLNPNDGFAHSVLGIVYYQMGRFDEAIDMLNRSIALDPKDARSHNYLGIACSQKGWQEAAEKSLRKALEIDPDYGDAHFNLAVIYATQKPPMLELAKKHYKMATDLGIPKDPQLEKFLLPATPAAPATPSAG